MLDQLVQPLSRTCHVTGRLFTPGETIYSVLIEDQGKISRIDYSRDSWSGPPAGPIAWWKTRIPRSSTAQTPKFRDELLWECLDRTAGDELRQPLHYVVALLLLRRKKLTYEACRTMPDGTNRMVIRDGRTGQTREIIDPQLTESEITAIQQEVIAACTE